MLKYVILFIKSFFTFLSRLKNPPQSYTNITANLKSVVLSGNITEFLKEFKIIINQLITLFTSALNKRLILNVSIH